MIDLTDTGLVPRVQPSRAAPVAAKPMPDRPLPAADSTTARIAAARAAAVSSELRRLQGELIGAVGSDGWSGTARLAFAAEMRTRATLLDPVIQRYDGYAAALQSYAIGLSGVEPALRSPQLQPTGSDGVMQPNPAFERAWQDWDEVRRRCVQALSAAGRIDADRHGLSRLWHAVTHGAHEVLDHVSLAELSKVLSELSDVLLVAGLVLSLVFPPAAAVVWVALAAVSATQLAVDSARVARGEKGVGWGDVAWDAAAVLPLGKMFRGAKTAKECSRLIEKLPKDQRVSRIVPGGLMSHEGTARGHLLDRHVRKSRRYLMARFKQTPFLKLSSSFKDRRTAEAASAWLLEERKDAIKTWLKHPTPQLELKGEFTDVVGRCFSRDGSKVRTRKLRLLLRPEQSILGYYLKTGHPEP